MVGRCRGQIRCARPGAECVRKGERQASRPLAQTLRGGERSSQIERFSLCDVDVDFLHEPRRPKAPPERKQALEVAKGRLQALFGRIDRPPHGGATIPGSDPGSSRRDVVAGMATGIAAIAGGSALAQAVQERLTEGPPSDVLGELDDYAHGVANPPQEQVRKPATPIARGKGSGTAGAEAGATETGVGKNAYRPPW